MSAAGDANITPPSQSKLPVTTLMASISQHAAGPNSFWQVPMRP